MREIQIKTTMTYHFKLTRVAIIKKPNKQQIPTVGEDVEELEPSYTAGGMWNGAATLENSLKSSSKS